MVKKQKKSTILIHSLLFFFGMISAESQILAAIKIMPLGDSITQMNSSYNSFRRPLWHLLQNAGYDVDFVGSENKNDLNSDPPDQDFDMDHEGHWGWRTDQILEQLDSWAATYLPDIVLIHLGSNDIAQHQSVSSTILEIGQVIDKLRDANSDVHIYLAQLIPLIRQDTIVPGIAEFNSDVITLAGQKHIPQSPVIVVDHWTGFSSSQDSFDGIHPNESGEERMANNWYSALWGDAVLPVTFSSFFAEAIKNEIILSWGTESEIQNLGFEVLRSLEKNGIYEQISSYLYNQELIGQYYSNVPSEYSYKDEFVSANTQYWYKIVDVSIDGVRSEHGPVSAIYLSDRTEPANFVLRQNYPNPFNSETTLTFDIPVTVNNYHDVSLVIFNELGERVKVLHKGAITSGDHKFIWDGKNESGYSVPSGIYYGNLRVVNYNKTVKMILSK